MTTPPPPASLAEALRDPAARAVFEGVLTPAQMALLDAAGTIGPAPAGAAPPAPALPRPDPALFDAALSGGFLPGEGGAAADWLVAHGAQVPGPPPRRLRLDPAALRALLDAAGAAPALAACLGAHAAADARLCADPDPDPGADTFAAWARSFLRPGAPLPDAVPAAHLEPAAAARAALGSAAALPAGLPPPAAYDRRRDLARLLDPFDVLTGRDAAGHDRFAGRAAELARLRAFVDVLPPEGAAEALGRIGKRMMTRMTATGPGDPRLMTIRAGGGLGKSTLMAKFVYDHALAGTGALPFAYLDFDRADLQPRLPEALLIETARQVSLQVPAEKPALDALRADLRAGLAGRHTPNPEAAYAAFRAAMARILASLGARTFLLVLDTAEIVQADPAAAQGAVAFVLRLAGSGADRLAGLCVVAAGRDGFPDFAAAAAPALRPEAMTLGPLDPAGARALVEGLGRAWLGDGWRAEWSATLAGGRGWRAVRHDPLVLRVATQLVRSAPEGERDALVRRLARGGAGVDAAFLGALLIDRTLGHIRDPGARALARPALAVRRLTQAMAVEALAPLAGLAPEAALAAFGGLAAETWLVTPDTVPEAGALQLNPEQRARLLPVLRHQDAAGLAAATDAVLRWLDGQTGDWAAGERAYLRLMQGDAAALAAAPLPLAQIEALAPAREDFAPGSVGRHMLDAVTGRSPLSAAGLRALPDALVWVHLARGGAGLRSPDLIRIDARTQALIARPFVATGAGVAERAAWAALLIRAGHWGPLQAADLPVPDAPDDLAPLLWWLGRAVAPRPALLAARLDRQPALVPAIMDRLPRAGWSPAALALPFLRAADPAAADAVDRMLTDVPETTGSGRLTDMLALRSAVLFGQAPARRAAAILLGVLAGSVRRALAPGGDPAPLMPAIVRLLGVVQASGVGGGLGGLADAALRGEGLGPVVEIVAGSAEGWVIPAAHALDRAPRQAPGLVSRLFAVGGEDDEPIVRLGRDSLGGRFDAVIADLGRGGDADLAEIAAARAAWRARLPGA